MVRTPFGSRRTDLPPLVKVYRLLAITVGRNGAIGTHAILRAPSCFDREPTIRMDGHVPGRKWLTVDAAQVGARGIDLLQSCPGPVLRQNPGSGSSLPRDS